MQSITRFEVSSTCFKTCPCQHKCTITTGSGEIRTVKLTAPEIAEQIRALTPHAVINPIGNDHFSAG